MGLKDSYSPVLGSDGADVEGVALGRSTQDGTGSAGEALYDLGVSLTSPSKSWVSTRDGWRCRREWPFAPMRWYPRQDSNLRHAV